MPRQRSQRRSDTDLHGDDHADELHNDENLNISDAPDPATASPEEFRKYNNRSVERVISILNVLQESSNGMTLAQISSTVKLAKASAFRYLWTLEKHRYVEREGNSGSYRLGLGFVGMQSRHLEVLRERARNSLERLRDETGESANLGMLDGDQIRYLDVAESKRWVRMATRSGHRDPLHCTALGKAIAAQLPEAQVRGILTRAGMERRTDNTITAVDDYLEELNKVRRRGYAIDDGENDVDGRCVAAPILGTSLPAALSVSGPASRFTTKDLEKVAKVLIEVADGIVTEPEDEDDVDEA
ncbi:IclR family transcriptional regulator [Phytoactinopolyspora alkaliphila]|uniref:IclR family transcriptional regulator n=1 Tax=Phytoactinopolyspora alkaliphila TaxID=1783498 RepID=A0A6N9YNK0_9ACTN|nr:IclR family transcriptional regulator [Phytoactinopolyspora alkaliphila]NED96409.1 IclR family transcriptional regulator [Phytoactinopolyspora alkaliphila]